MFCECMHLHGINEFDKNCTSRLMWIMVWRNWQKNELEKIKRVFGTCT